MSIPTTSKLIQSHRQQNVKGSTRDTIQFYIDSAVCPLLNPAMTKLRFNVKLSGDTKAQLDGLAGGNAVIETLSVYTQDGVLLEQVDTYNNLVGCKFHYDTTQGLRNIRSLTEGLSPNGITNQVESGLASLYFDMPTNNVVGQTGGDPLFQSVECVLPFHFSGVLGGDKVMPVAACSGGGLRVDIKLSSPTKAIKAYTATGMTPGNNQKFLLSNDTLNVGVIDNITPGNILLLGISGNAVGAVGAADFIPAQPSLCNITKGQTLTIEGTGAAGADLTTTKVVSWEVVVPPNGGEALKVVLEAGTAVATAFAVGGAARYVYINQASVGQDTALDYEISDAQMVLGCVNPEADYFRSMMSAIKARGALTYDCRSWNVYRHNSDANIPQLQTLINATEFRALSLLCPNFDGVESVLSSSLTPLVDGIQSYQLNIDNKMVPNREVETEKMSDVNDTWNAVAVGEMSKALDAFGVSCRNENKMGKWFFVGRRLATPGHSFNARDKEIRLRQTYTAADKNVNAVMNAYVHHIRTFKLSPAVCEVMY